MNKSNSIGLSGFIFLIFLFLKLAGIGEVATWSWWWVTSPLWMPLGICLAILGVIGIVYSIVTVITGIGNMTERRQRRRVQETLDKMRRGA